jgi:TolB-like protein/Tfp pilus assembly protein PilF
MSGDPDQEYFADGITEDLTTDLSGIRGLFVIARNSAFTYKGKAVSVEEVGRELGVRYVLEGSVRKAGDRVRITAQLIDASTGFHLWSERFDRELVDLFALQSEISEEILGSLQVEIREAEVERIRHEPTEDLSAHDAVTRGRWHLNRMTRADNAEARSLFESAIELDPAYADAYAWLGATYSLERVNGWNLDLELRDRAAELGRKALELDPLLPAGHLRLAAAHFSRGRVEEAIAAAERAIELAPSLDVAYFLLALGRTGQGRFLAAGQALKRAMRLNPRPPPLYQLLLGWLNLQAGRTGEAVRLWEEVRASNPDQISVRAALALHYEGQGRHEEARTLVEEILRVNPDMTAGNAARANFNRSDPEFFPGAEDLLRRAGLPDVPSRAAGEFTVPEFGGAPAVAVLPFDNLSGDPEQEYFADGLAEDLITRLSGGGRFPVIARNSSFTYKGRAVDVQQVGRELGARYVVGGSVRRAGDHVRISVQLIDATTGTHRWGESYDRELRDVFALQDDIVEEVVRNMGLELRQSEWLRAVREQPRDPAAYDLVMRGWWHLARASKKEDNARARSFFQRATELDPSYTEAWLGLARTHNADLLAGWSDSPAASMDELGRAARACIEANNQDANCYLVLSQLHDRRGERVEHMAALERAISLDPGNADAQGWMGFHLSYRGMPEEALAHLEKAMRLDPISPLQAWWHIGVAYVHFDAGRYEAAADWARQGVRFEPGPGFANLALAASLGQLGRIEEARAVMSEVTRVYPRLTLETLDASTNMFRANPDFHERLRDGLRRAGLPEV